MKVRIVDPTHEREGQVFKVREAWRLTGIDSYLLDYPPGENWSFYGHQIEIVDENTPVNKNDPQSFPERVEIKKQIERGKAKNNQFATLKDINTNPNMIIGLLED